MHDLYDHLYDSHAALYQHSLPHALYEYGLAIYGFNTVHAQYKEMLWHRMFTLMLLIKIMINNNMYRVLPRNFER